MRAHVPYLLFLLLGCTSVMADDLFLPHFTVVPDQWDTEMSLVNAGATAQDVQITAFDNDGQQAAAAQWTLAPSVTLRGSVKQLFPEMTATKGWFRVQTSGAEVSGQVRFTALTTGGSSTLPLTSLSGTRLVLPGVDVNDQWNGGLAVVNTSDQETALDIRVFATDGRVLEETTTNLPPRGKWVGMLNQLFPATELTAQNTVIFSSDEPLVAFGLNFAGGASQVVAVPATVAPGRRERVITATDELAGDWRRMGYGNFLHVDEDGFYYMDTTEGTCITELDEFPHALFELGIFEAVETADGRLRIATSDGTTIFFERTDQVLPTEGCEPELDFETNFETMVDIFNQHYAFFEARGVDWQALSDSYRARLGEVQNQQQLAELMGEMLYQLDDAHVGLSAGEFGNYDATHPRAYGLALMERFEQQSRVTDFEAFRTEDLEASVSVATSYLDPATIKGGGNGRIYWGRFAQDPNIGYLGITLMMGYTDDIFDIEANLAALWETLNQALADIGDATSVVVDVRLNPGGMDVSSAMIADRFADQRRRAYSKTARDGASQTPWQTFWLEPQIEVPHFQGQKLVLLTSEMTTSAAEVFTLRMRALPHLVQIGETTAGAMSDILTKTLPNGWDVELSNEIYLDRDGVLWEGPGIAPHVVVPHFRESDRNAGRDSVLEKALEMLAD